MANKKKGVAKRRQQKRIRRNRSRKQQNKRFTASDDYFVRKGLIKRARNFPIFECLISETWQERGLAQILIARKQPNGNFAVGSYLVDIFCLGLKSTFCNADITPDEYVHKFKAGMMRNDRIVDCNPNTAYSVIYGGIEYARKLGFKPAPDFKLARYILDDPRDIELEEIEFGKDGQPFFINGPTDNVDQVLQTLNRTCGEGNYKFLYQTGEPHELF